MSKEIPGLLKPIHNHPSEAEVQELENAHEDAVYKLYKQIDSSIPVPAFSAVALLNLKKRLYEAKSSHDTSGEEIFTRLTMGLPSDLFLDLRPARRHARDLAIASFRDWIPTDDLDDARFKVFDLSSESTGDMRLSAVAIKLPVGTARHALFEPIDVVGRHYGIIDLSDEHLEEHEKIALKILSVRDTAEGSEFYPSDTFEPFKKVARNALMRIVATAEGTQIVPVVESLYSTEPLVANR